MATEIEMIDTMLGDDDTLAVDKAKLSADQVADDASHADVFSLLTTKGKRFKLSADGSSVTIFSANPAGTIDVEVVQAAASA